MVISVDMVNIRMIVVGAMFLDVIGLSHCNGRLCISVAYNWMVGVKRSLVVGLCDK